MTHNRHLIHSAYHCNGRQFFYFPAQITVLRTPRLQPDLRSLLQDFSYLHIRSGVSLIGVPQRLCLNILLYLLYGHNQTDGSQKLHSSPAWSCRGYGRKKTPPGKSSVLIPSSQNLQLLPAPYVPFRWHTPHLR